MAKMTRAVAESKIEEGYKAAGGKKALPWAAIIQAFLSMLTGCTAKTAKDSCKEHPLAMAILFRRHLVNEDIVSKSEAAKVAPVAVDLFNSTSLPNVESVIEG